MKIHKGWKVSAYAATWLDPEGVLTKSWSRYRDMPRKRGRLTDQEKMARIMSIHYRRMND